MWCLTLVGGREQTTVYKGVETFSWQTCFKILRGNPKEKAQRAQYLLAVDLARYNLVVTPTQLSSIGP